jgi:hypothetical protein
MFVGAFGLDIAKYPTNPPTVDLCGVVDALLGSHEDRKSGHDLLVDLVNSRNLEHVTGYIRMKLTEGEARIVYACLRRRPEKIDAFVDVIPSPLTVYVAQGAVGASAAVATTINNSIQYSGIAAYGGDILGNLAGRVAAYVEETVDNSEALKIARRITEEWMGEFNCLEPRVVSGVIQLLEKLYEQAARDNRDEGRAQERRREDAYKKDKTLLDTIRDYLYGGTPIKTLSDPH